jgi:hypothetical protein
MDEKYYIDLESLEYYHCIRELDEHQEELSEFMDYVSADSSSFVFTLDTTHLSLNNQNNSPHTATLILRNDWSELNVNAHLSDLKHTSKSMMTHQYEKSKFTTNSYVGDMDLDIPLVV